MVGIEACGSLQPEVRREALRFTSSLLRGCSSASTRREVRYLVGTSIL